MRILRYTAVTATLVVGAAVGAWLLARRYERGLMKRVLEGDLSAVGELDDWRAMTRGRAAR